MAGNTESLLRSRQMRASSAVPERRSRRFRQIVLNHLQAERWTLLLAVASTLGTTAMDLLGPWPLKIIVDYILLDRPLPASLSALAGIFSQQKVWALLLTAGFMALIAILGGVFSYAQVYLTSRTGYQLVYRLRTELFAHLQQLSLSFHHRARRGELLTRVASDTSTLKEAFSTTILDFTSEMLTFTGMFIVMFVLNWRLSLIVILSFPILFVIFLHLQRKLKDSVRRQRKKEGRVTSQLSEVLTAMLLVQAFGRENYETRRFRQESAENLEEGIRLARLDAAVTRSVAIVGSVGLTAVVILGALEALQGNLSPGDVLIFASYVKSIYKPIGKVARLFTKLNKASVSARRVAEILDLDPEIQDKPDAIVASGLRGEIIFDRVSFAYEEGGYALRDISFRLAPGGRLALVGASGAGKSTIASLILRLYDPQQGKILIDGIDIREYQRQSLRQQIGLVLQDSILFGATVRENISYGHPGTSMAQIIAAARQAQAHDFIMALPQGYDTPIGEMGSTLSGGQRQRIAIARALVKNPPILILDEPTSALDASSKAMVEETLEKVHAGKSILMIAHSLESIKTFDHILVLQDGQIVEQGTHDELMALRGLYLNTVAQVQKQI